MVVCNSKTQESKTSVLVNVFNDFASVAQLVEQLTLNQLVRGSSPRGATTFGGARATHVLSKTLSFRDSPDALRAEPPQPWPV